MKSSTRRILALAAFLALFDPAAFAQTNLEVNTPAIAALRATMRDRHQQLKPHYASGALGLTRDGRVEVRDANAIPLAERQRITGMVAESNRDRAALYKEIAIANGHPEWEGEIRSTFAQRWIDKAPAGWWVQNANGAWVKK